MLISRATYLRSPTEKVCSGHCFVRTDPAAVVVTLPIVMQQTRRPLSSLLLAQRLAGQHSVGISRVLGHLHQFCEQSVALRVYPCEFGGQVSSGLRG